LKMNYSQTLDFLYSQLPAYHRIGKAAYKSDLGNSLSFDKYFGMPHSKYLSIHVAGTNGKGSVSHMIASILQEAGLKTGLYTSPHLKDFRERIKINGEMIPEEEVVGFVELHRKIIESLNPSFFELTVALAFDYFANEKIDVAVVEVGLGGRLDSTNIIDPLLSVITNIGHDHMDLLGDSFAKIAFEKAGIIKKNKPVVIGEFTPETKPVFLNKAIENESYIYFAEEKFRCTLDSGFTPDKPRGFSLENLNTKEKIIGCTPLKGDYQARNIQTVYTALEVLKSTLRISPEQISDGIKNVISATGLSGRWQILGNNPFIVCDTGHNKEGLEYVMGQLARIKKEKLHIVLGFVNDKDLASVLPLFPKDAFYYFTKASIPRALDEKILQIEAKKYGLKGNIFSTVGAALENARHTASKDDVVFIGGSTFVVAEVV
jgi:dihydrofolate synthase / folylpolyglutamate synthase